MNSKIKNFCIPLLLMIIINLSDYYFFKAPTIGADVDPHLGILFISGLFFGPYGCMGAVLGNFLCDIVRGFSIYMSLVSAVISFLISYLAYKLWYTNDSDKFIVTRPRLNKSYDLIYLLIIIFECGLLYSVLISNIAELVYHNVVSFKYHLVLSYFVNFINFALLFSNIFILISRFKDFSYVPEISEIYESVKKYKVVYYLIILMALIGIIFDIFGSNYEITIFETLLLIILLIIYIKKPIKKINHINYVSIPERIMNYFIMLTLVLLLTNVIIITSPLNQWMLDAIYITAYNQQYLIFLLLLDSNVLLFFLPALILLTYIERKVINPIKTFSKIESFIKKDKRIESDKILDIYSDYINQDDEIGILSRSYSNLIENNNDYIDNLESLEAEKQRNKAELNIAHNIQQATLPQKEIDNEYIWVTGFCKPAREVGGDFYDFYEIDDDNTMIIIGDASGKGVPAAIFTIIIQYSIKLLIKNDLNPASVLFDINNQICENNTEMMFITLFLAIYNNKTHKLTYANAGHNPPIIKNKTGYEFLSVDSEIVMGVLEEYNYSNYETVVKDEFILYTDGITDSQNSEHELYGEERLINCFNNADGLDIINTLLKDIHEFSKDEEQFDDMTLLKLKVKK